jgi:membrane-bound lytic murein transglycosylase D
MVPVKEINDNLITAYPSYKDIPKLPSKIKIRKREAPSNYSKVIYIVKSGDNLGNIADKFDVKLKNLRSWNNLEYSSLIKPGRKLSIFVPPGFASRASTVKKIKMVYIVKKGDTLNSICRKYYTSITNILKWNKDIKNNKLYPGNRITIFVEDGQDYSTSGMK